LADGWVSVVSTRSDRAGADGEGPAAECWCAGWRKKARSFTWRNQEGPWPLAGISAGPGPGATVDDLVSAYQTLRTPDHPSPREVAVDGFKGKQISITMPDYDPSKMHRGQLRHPSGGPGFRYVSESLGTGAQAAESVVDPRRRRHPPFGCSTQCLLGTPARSSGLGGPSQAYHASSRPGMAHGAGVRRDRRSADPTTETRSAVRRTPAEMLPRKVDFKLP